MRLSLNSLVRLAALLGVVLFASAVGLSRAVPKSARFRTEGPARFHGVNGTLLDPPDARSFLLDAQSGTLRPFEPVAGYRVECASVSPWTGERGSEVVARLVPTTAQRDDCPTTGLVRFPLAGGPIQREVPGSAVVAGRACWLPGSPSRVVFPAGDGGLYLQDLTAGGVDTGDDEGVPTPPLRLAWRAGLEDGEYGFLADAACPPASALGGRLVVILYPGRKDGPKVRLGAPQIWWLKLDPGATAIAAAGRLTVPVQDDCGADEQERLPNVGVSPDGRTILSYLSRPSDRNTWRLKVAPIDLDPHSGEPRVRADEVHDLGAGYATTAPVFSPDGRWLLAVLRRETRDGRVRKFEVADVLGGGSTGARHLASVYSR